jgi:ATP:ADP antiporter, AAA family
LVVSVFWSSVSNVIEKSNALRLYALIAAGGTLGALVGPLLATLLSRYFHSSSLLLTSIICLGVAFAIQIATASKGSEKKINNNELNPEQRTWLFPGIKSILISPKLLSIASFMALYICMSGFIYFQQSVSLPKYLVSSNERIQYFAGLDLTVNFLVLIVQLFLTSKIYRWFAPKRVLVFAPLLVGCTFLFLHIGSPVFLISLASIVHRVVHFSLLVPARESAYAEINTDNFYSSKTTIDTLFYRGSDALFGWGLSVLFAFSLTTTQLMVIGLTISIIWSVSGYYLGKKFNVFQNSTT